MKLFILKLLSLVVFCLGLASLLVALGFPEVQAGLAQLPALLADLQEKLPPELEFLESLLTVQGLWFTGSIMAIVFGIYGFFPRFAKRRKPKKITYEGPHGEVQIQLESVEHSLNHVLARMPEVKRINVKVDPHDGGRRAYIKADVVLNQLPGQNARAIASLVSDYIAETATKLLGLEELATIDLNVTGINVNSRRSSRAIRKESLSHSGNAPVELLEASPAPLTLSGPREPLGSGPIEEELEGDSDRDAMDAEAIDTKHEVANQAAARSELLEPLNVGTPINARRGKGDEDTHVGESAAASEAPHSKDARHSGVVAASGVVPLDMDVLHESLEVAGDDAEYVEVEQDEDEDDHDAARSFEAGGGGGEDTGEEALDDDPAYGGALATPVDDVADSDGADNSPFADAEDIERAEADDDTADTGFQPGGRVEAFGEDTETAEEAAESDSSEEALHQEYRGGVTIPETEEEAGAQGESEKKRWGWFN